MCAEYVFFLKMIGKLNCTHVLPGLKMNWC